MFILGSYHKTGTELFNNIWDTYKKLLNEKQNETNVKDNNNEKIYSFYHHFNNVSAEEIIAHKCIVLIRNPYEIIMSGVRYHKITDEAWCCSPQDRFNNLSYKEYISSLPDNEKIIFEMKNCGQHTLKHIYNDMKNRNYGNQVYFIKLEDLYDIDNIPIICKKIVEHLDESENINLDFLIEAFETNLSKSFHRTNNSNNYTYPDEFKEQDYIEFNKLFPNDIVTIMGYE